MKGVEGRNVTQMVSLVQILVKSQLFGDGVTEASGKPSTLTKSSNAMLSISGLTGSSVPPTATRKNAEVNRVECAEKDCKIDGSATKKIECYIDVLMATPIGAHG